MFPTKSRLRIFASLIIVGALASCGAPSDKKTEGNGANANANQNAANVPAKSSGPAARLDRFVGSWGGYAGRTTAVSGKVGLDSRFMKSVVKQAGPDTVALEGDIWQAKATLKYDTNSQKYLLSLTAEDFPQISDLPMSFSDSDGFSGDTTFTNKGKEFKAKATIKDDKGASEWHLNVTQGKDMWGLTIRLGKEQ